MDPTEAFLHMGMERGRGVQSAMEGTWIKQSAWCNKSTESERVASVPSPWPSTTDSCVKARCPAHLPTPMAITGNK